MPPGNSMISIVTKSSLSTSSWQENSIRSTLLATLTSALHGWNLSATDTLYLFYLTNMNTGMLIMSFCVICSNLQKIPSLKKASVKICHVRSSTKASSGSSLYLFMIFLTFCQLFHLLYVSTFLINSYRFATLSCPHILVNLNSGLQKASQTEKSLTKNQMLLKCRNTLN